jgi:hypothetical protein
VAWAGSLCELADHRSTTNLKLGRRGKIASGKIASMSKQKSVGRSDRRRFEFLYPARINKHCDLFRRRKWLAIDVPPTTYQPAYLLTHYARRRPTPPNPSPHRFSRLFPPFPSPLAQSSPIQSSPSQILQLGNQISSHPTAPLTPPPGPCSTPQMHHVTKMRSI